MQRVPLAPSTIEAGHTHWYYDDSPPRTPTHVKRAAKGKGRGDASRAVKSRPALRETFLDKSAAEDHVKGIRDGYGNDEQDSHDLSLSPIHVTRDSVVDNMLLSLDQFPTSGTPHPRVSNPERSRSQASIYEADPYSVGPRLTSARKGHHRGHTQSSSLSSEHDPRTEDDSSRSPTHFSRTRRSHSSSNFQSGLRRIDSTREEDESTKNTRANMSAARRAADSDEGDTGVASRAGRKGSKSSGSTSLGISQMVGAPRRQRPIDRRSSSIDHFYGSRGTYTSPSTGNTTIVNSRSEPLLYDDSEAAPTPTIPVGPRRERSSPSAVVFLPRLAPASSQAPLSRPHDSTDRSGSQTAWWGIPESDDTAGMEGKQEHYEGMRATLPEFPSLPAFFNPPTPSPSVSYEKPLLASTQDAAPYMKERPGFFRRVFGSSRNNITTAYDLHRPASSLAEPSSLQASLRADNRNAQLPQILPQSKLHKPAVRGGTPVPPTKDTSQAPLSKKSSSFFRRRKKSISEYHPSPVVPVHFQPPVNDSVTDQPGEHSPVSSLRKVMSPYLHTSIISHNEEQQGENVSKYDAAFITGYTARNESRMKPLKAASAGQGLASPLRESPNTSGSGFPKLDFNPPTSHDDSFLQDSSGNEGKVRPRRAPLLVDLVKESSGRPKTSPKPLKSAKRSTPQDEKSTPRRASPTADDVPESLIANTSVSPRPSSPRSRNITTSKRTADGIRDGVEPKEWTTTAHLTSARDKLSPRMLSSKSDRVWLEPTSSEEDVNESVKLSPSLERAPDSARGSGSSSSDYKSAYSRLPTSPLKSNIEDPVMQVEAELAEDKPYIDATEPTVQDRQQAKKIYDGNEVIVAKTKAAAWLGESGADRTRVLRAYMELFEWQNLNILAALRDLCGRLLLKGETQQVDRILDAFSTRWCSCNANHGFKATDVVHTICYSVLLLNTDLHLAEIEQKMTRAQFIKNTMPTIRRVAADAAPGGFENVRVTPSNETTEVYIPPSGAISPTFPLNPQQGRSSNDGQRPSYGLVTRPSDSSGHEILTNQPLTPLDYDTPLDDCGPLVKAPFHGRLSTWEVQVEIVLKDFYNSIRHQRLPLYGGGVAERGPEPAPSMTSLSALTGSMLRRTPSMLSKTGSEHFFSRGRTTENRPGTGRWAAKTRSRPRLYPASTMGSSRTSLDDDHMWSPSVSSTWSKYSFGKTQTSMSVDSFGSTLPQGDYQQSIGFANALSQAIIREEAAGSNTADENIRSAPLLEDENLGLAGAPWAKEGILKHKHHLESVDKKAKDRNWTECFAVIEKGWMRLFSFNMNAKSMRQKAKNQKAPGGVVGGGNWSENAEALGKFLLRQTIASALPPPGYSKARPHVWALSLPSGAVHLFQVGTPEIVKEFVTTANYWSARLSKEPLVGGISNIEYGWGGSVINNALVQSENRPPSAANTGGPRPSLQGSIRSSLDQGGVKPKLPGDKVLINDWTPPQQSMAASALMEVDQLKGFLTYVKNVEEELQIHNELRSAMLLAYSPRYPNSAKAMANWERKSSHLLREIVKFRTYIDCLQAAQVAKENLYASRALPAKEAEEEGASAPEAVSASG